MAKIFGEAFFDASKAKYFYRIVANGEDEQILHESGAEFDTQHEAERELVALLRGLKNASGTSTP
jgi:hypothetical protein